MKSLSFRKAPFGCKETNDTRKLALFQLNQIGELIDVKTVWKLFKHIRIFARLTTPTLAHSKDMAYLNEHVYTHQSCP